MPTLLAAAPILLVIAALIARQSITRASLLGLVTALVLGATVFDLDRTSAAAALAHWWEPACEVIVIIAGGIAFAEAARRTGSQDHVSTWLRENPGIGVPAVLAIVHGATPLAESLTGFGIGIAVGVPLLFGLGLGARRSAVIGLLGLCAVPWGSMGPGTLVAAQLGSVGFDELGVAGALLSLPVFWGVGLVAALMVAENGRRGAAVLAALASGTGLGATILIANLLVGTAPAGAVGSGAVLAGHIALRRLRGGRLRAVAGLGSALVPYLVLLGGVLIAAITVRALGLAETPWHLLASPALWLIAATATALRHQGEQARLTIASALRSWTGIGPATGVFILLGAALSAAGMSRQLAAALAGLGPLFPASVPLLGGVGGYLSGSKTGANAMFAGPQAETAAALGLPVLVVLALGNVAGSLLTMAAPGRVALAVSLCPDPPDARGVTRDMLTVDAALLAVLAAVAMAVLSPGA